MWRIERRRQQAPGRIYQARDLKLAAELNLEMRTRLIRTPSISFSELSRKFIALRSSINGKDVECYIQYENARKNI